jgi:peptidyl-prolyl cis-trans isomerase B (cyclophilin B)
MFQRWHVLVGIMVVLMLVGGMSCKDEESAIKESATEETTTMEGEEMAEPVESAPTEGGNEVAVIQTTMGTIVLEFFDDAAPNHVANFKKLAREKFYDGIYFHRVIPDFMIQAGCPLTRDDKNRSNDGTGGPGYTIDAEFNDRPHKRGTLSMARKPDPNSAGSQFFICHEAQPGLDGQYTVFGKVIDGMEVVDKIAMAERDARDNPIEKIFMEKVTIEVR